MILWVKGDRGGVIGWIRGGHRVGEGCEGLRWGVRGIDKGCIEKESLKKKEVSRNSVQSRGFYRGYKNIDQMSIWIDVDVDGAPDNPIYLPTISVYGDELCIARAPVRCRRGWPLPPPRLYALPLLLPPVDQQQQRRHPLHVGGWSWWLV